MPPSGADCVLKACQPGDWDLHPYPGCNVWATLAPPAGASVAGGPFLNRTNLAAPGVLAPVASSLAFVGWSTAPPAARFAWAAGRRGSPAGTPWPPPGLTLTARFAGAGGAYAGLSVE